MNIVRHFLAVATVCISVIAPRAIAQVPDTLKLSIPGPTGGLQRSTNFGSSVATDGNYSVVGAPGATTTAYHSGEVKVFDATSGALLFVLPNPTPADSDSFGGSVAISGTRVLVGDLGGTIYVFDLASGTPTVPVIALSPLWDGPVSVAISGTRVVVGAPRTVNYWMIPGTMIEVGRAFVYDLSGAVVS